MAKKEVNVKLIQTIYKNPINLTLKPILALTMHASGATYENIGNVFGVSRQRAEQMVAKAKEDLKCIQREL